MKKSNGKQGIYRVFYARFPFDVTYGRRTVLDQEPPAVTVASMEKTHVFLFEVLGTSIESVFECLLAAAGRKLVTSWRGSTTD